LKKRERSDSEDVVAVQMMSACRQAAWMPEVWRQGTLCCWMVGADLGWYCLKGVTICR